MGAKICFLWIFLASLCYVQSEQLEDDINLRVLNVFNPNKNLVVDFQTVKSRSLTFEELKNITRQIDIVDILVKSIIDSQTETISGLERSLTEKSVNTGEDIVAAINSATKLNLLIVRGEQVNVDTSQLQKFLLKQTRALVKQAYPQDLIKQLMTYATLSTQINNAFKEVKPTLNEYSLSLSVFAEIAESLSGTDTRVRRSLLSSLTSSLTSNLSSTISTATSSITSVISSTLTSLETTVLSLYISSTSSNEVVAYFETFWNTVITALAELLEELSSVVSSLSDTIASYITSLLRKRRDLEFSPDTELQEELVRGALIDGTALMRSTRSITVASALVYIFKILWEIVSIPLKYAAKYLVTYLISYLESYVTSFLDGTVTSMLYSIINSIF